MSPEAKRFFEIVNRWYDHERTAEIAMGTGAFSQWKQRSPPRAAYYVLKDLIPIRLKDKTRKLEQQIKELELEMELLKIQAESDRTQLKAEGIDKGKKKIRVSKTPDWLFTNDVKEKRRENQKNNQHKFRAKRELKIAQEQKAELAKRSRSSNEALIVQSLPDEQ